MKRALGLGLLSGLMALSVTPAFATEEQQAPTATNLTVSKTFETADGMKSLPTSTFSFDVEKKTVDAPDLTIGQVNYGSGDTLSNPTDGKYSVTKNANVSFGNFLHAGQYHYEISEQKGNVTGVTYDTNKYDLYVNVANPDQSHSNLYIKDLFVKENGKDKTGSINFVNKYVKDSSLKISKTVTGDLGNHEKPFTFEIKMTKAATDQTGTFTADQDVTEKGTNTSTKILVSGKTYTFTLKHGQSLNFASLPVGTKYEVTEQGDNDYKPSYKINGATTATEGTKGSELSTGSQTVKEDEDNKAEFINEDNTTVVTGVVINNLPYILLAGLGVIGCALLAVFKRRKLSK